jgi:hypothetical protein
MHLSVIFVHSFGDTSEEVLAADYESQDQQSDPVNTSKNFLQSEI